MFDNVTDARVRSAITTAKPKLPELLYALEVSENSLAEDEANPDIYYGVIAERRTAIDWANVHFAALSVDNTQRELRNFWSV